MMVDELEVYLHEDNAVVINHDEKWFAVIKQTELDKYIDVNDEGFNPDGDIAANLYIEDIFFVIDPLEEQGYFDKEDQ